MIKRTIKETVTEYDKDGKVIRETVTETTEDDDTQFTPFYPYSGGLTYTVDPAIYRIERPEVTCQTVPLGAKTECNLRGGSSI